MNEHDSERIAGLLAAEGMEPTDDLEEADVVVLNTCCIRENADNKLYGHLGRLKELKDGAPTCRSRSAAAWPRRTATGAGEGAARRRGVRHPQSRARARAARPGALEGPIVEILEEHEAYPSALPARREVDHSAWITIQIGCDNTCAFCIVPQVRGAEVSRRMGDIVHEVEELARDGVARSRCSARTSTRTVVISARGSTARSSPICCARSTRSTASNASASRRRTPRICAPRRSRRWPSARTCASTCTCRCSRAAIARSRACTAVTPPSAISSDLPRRGPRSPISRSPPTSSSASPARPTTTSSARSRSSSCRVRRRLHVHVLAAAGHRSREMVDDFVAAEVMRRADGASPRGGRAPRAAQARARVGRVEEVLVEGPSKKDAAMWSGRTRQNKLVHFVPDAATEPGDVVARPASSTRPRTGCAASSTTQVQPAPRRRVAHPGRGGVTRHLALVGTTAIGQVGDARWRSHGGSATSRSSRSTRCRCTAGWTSAPRSRRAAERAEVPHHLIDVADPARGMVGARDATRGARRARPTSKRAGGGRCSSAGPGLYVRAVVDALDIPPSDMRCAPTRSARPRRCGPGVCLRRLRRLDPTAASRMEPGNRRRIVRALEVFELTGRPFSSFGPGLDEYGPPAIDVALVGLWLPRRRARREESPRASLRCATPAWSTRCGALARAGWPVTYGPPGDRLQGVLAYLRGRAPSRSMPRSTWPSGGRVSSRGASGCGSGVIRGSIGSTPRRNPARPRAP